MITLALPLAGVIVATYTDLRTGFIRNWLTAPLFLSGVAYSLYINGMQGLFEALLASACFSAMAWIYAPAVGGGDLKLTMGVGAWLGLENLWLFFFGVGILRVLIGTLLRYKVYGPGVLSFLSGVWTELKMFPAPFTPGDNKGLPGAVTVLGGVVSVAAIKMLGKGV